MLTGLLLFSWTGKAKVSPQDAPRPSSQNKADLFAPDGQRTENKRQRLDIEDEGEGNKEEGKGVFLQARRGDK